MIKRNMSNIIKIDIILPQHYDHVQDPPSFVQSYIARAAPSIPAKLQGSALRSAVLELMKAKALGGKMSDLSKTYQYQYVQELHLVVCVLSTVQFFKKTTEKNAFIVFSNQIVLVSIICWKIWVGSAGSDSAYSLPFSASFLLSIAQLLGFGLLFRCFSLPWRAWNVESIHVLSFAMFYDFMCSVFYTLQLTDFCCSSVRQLWGSQFHSFNSYCTEQLFESVLCQSWLAC